jgi:glutamyl-tRNA reductase
VSIVALGLSHHSAAVSLRERLAFNAPQLPETLLRLSSGIAKRLSNASAGRYENNVKPEITLLSTCNRTELYWHRPSALHVNGPTSPAALEIAKIEQMALLESVAELGALSASQLAPHIYQRQSTDAARHAFRVASGLDSMVIGETQILGQLKTAVRAAQDAGTLGTTLRQLFDRSFTVAKAVRSNTELGSHSISMAAAAVRLAERVFGDMAEQQVLFVGAGEMIELAATHFAARNPKSMTISNRTESRAQLLQQKFKANFLPLAQLGDSLHQYDVIITCTASSVPIIGLGAVKRALKNRRSKPMLIVDLAVPRDVEPEAKALQNIFLYTVDDLAQLVEQGKEHRHAAVAQAELIVDQGVLSFMQWLEQRSSAPVLGHLNQHVEGIRLAEIERALKHLNRGEDPQKVMELLSKGLIGKLMHGTYVGMHVADRDERQRTEESVRKLWLNAQRRSEHSSKDDSTNKTRH